MDLHQSTFTGKLQQLRDAVRDSYPKILLINIREKIMRLLRAVSTAAILMLAFVSPAEATTPSNSIVKLMVSASAGNMPMAANSKMTTAMSGSAWSYT